MPRETETRPGAQVPWQRARRRGQVPALGAHSGNQEARARAPRRAREPARRARSRRPPGRRGRRSIARRPARHVPVQRRAVRHEVLHRAAARVGRPGEHVDASGPGTRGTARSRPRRGTARASPRRPPRRPKSACRVALGGRADVAALGVEDAGTAPAGTSARRRSSAAQPAEPNASKKATLIFTAHDLRRRRPRSGRARTSRPRRHRGEGLGQLVGVRVDARGRAAPRGARRAPRSRDRGGRHPARASSRRAAGAAASERAGGRHRR